jgi:aspartate--ammonia ligase
LRAPRTAGTRDVAPLDLSSRVSSHHTGLCNHLLLITSPLPRHLSIGGGIGQGRVQMLLLRKAHLGEATVTVWPRQLHKVCERHNIFVLK